MQKAGDWLLKRNCLDPIEQIRVAEFHSPATRGNLARLDEGCMDLLAVRQFTSAH